MTAIESKEEISDTDSGIILHSGEKRALDLFHDMKFGVIELFFFSLQELTGKLPSDYPLMPDENTPQVRRRIGASFKLDEGLIYLEKEDSELHGLETELALQRQIYEAARKLSLEEKLSKPQKKSRMQQCKREEKKVRELQEALFQCRIRSDFNLTFVFNPDLNMSDDSSLSDVVALDEGNRRQIFSPSIFLGPCQPLMPAGDHLESRSCHQLPAGPQHVSQSCYERSPIQNSPWKESSLDQPYLKATKSQPAGSSSSSSTMGTQVSADSNRIPLSQFIKNSALRHSHSASAPSTPELHVRRQYSQSFRYTRQNMQKKKNEEKCTLLYKPSLRVRSRLPQRRCVADFLVLSPESSSLRAYQSSSEDSSSEHSTCSYMPGQDVPTEIPKLSPPPYGFHSAAPKKVPPGCGNAPLLSPQDLSKHLVSQRPWQEGRASERKMPKLPPPYTRVMRTPSLKEYPSIMPKEVVSEELKSWRQRSQSHNLVRDCEELQSPLGAKSPILLHIPPFNQRAADGTPVQWFVAEDHEIVSQV
uniref:Innate immunity activator n=1 Tax=Hippocampus comes TaxID=109280 RepID=A0A3Q2YS92_HIPCM